MFIPRTKWMHTLPPVPVAVVDFLQESDLGNRDPSGSWSEVNIVVCERFAAISISVHASVHVSLFQQFKVNQSTEYIS